MTWQQHLTQGFITVAIVAAALAIYDRGVRVPQTPRLALVDVSRLYTVAQKQAAKSALDLVERGTKSANIGDDVANAALGQIEKTAADFGPRLNAALDTLAQECQCTVVAMAAVHGADSGMPDYTALVADRLKLRLES